MYIVSLIEIRFGSFDIQNSGWFELLFHCLRLIGEGWCNQKTSKNWGMVVWW